MSSIKSKDVLFIMVFICIYSLCFSFQFFSEKQKLYFELSNNLYTKNHAVFVNNDKWNLSGNLVKSDYRLFLELNNSFRFLLHSGQWKPPMLSGEFFSDNDPELKAVIGKEMTKYLKEDNGRNYISFQNNKYYVTGIIGKDYASSSDYLVLLHHPNPEISTSNRLILDSDNKFTIKKLTKRVFDLNPSISQIEGTQKGLYRTGNLSYYYYLLLVELYLLVLVGIISFLRYRYEKDKAEIMVLFLLGIPKKIIHTKLVIKASCLILLSGLISFGLICALHSVSFPQLIINACIFLLASWICMYIFIRNDRPGHKRGVANSDIQ